ncbi:hypothetical protein H2203_000343 [Taxawa tesnikishii (nom. ined.)]|nr:hypothetical protein H2203_000343 [Dothideales sp. JES 119]
MKMEIMKQELVSPGYVFIAPYRNVDPGPYIYDNWGNLVWSGAGSSGPKTAHNPHVCQYRGEDHLCYFQGEQHQGFARGHGVIMDKNYRIVKTVESSGAGASADMHEFRMTPYSNSTTALVTVYQPRMYDLTTNSRFNIKSGMGWIVEGVFQEVEIDTGNVVFEWRSTDHLDPSLSYTFPGTTDTSGNGLHEDTPWDYFHINSIDKNSEGDYLISARHMAAIYKLSGVDGHIMWEMGHHARWISENGTHTLLRFYDNASNGYNRTDAFSHGYIISINHIDNTATMIAQYGAPEQSGGILSGSQGNMQLLPNGNVHIGWGEHAYFTEHTPDGQAVMYGKLADRASNVMVYRSNKYNWTATPLTKPALWTYSRSKQRRSGTVFYVSWNGATEVRSWNFYTSQNATGPFTFVGNVIKTGFETRMVTTNHTEWAFAEAMDANGNALERSVIAKTFVPSDSLRAFCDDYGCGKAEASGPGDRLSKDPKYTPVKEEYLSINRDFNTSKYYADLPYSNSSYLSGRLSTGGLKMAAGVVALLALSLVVLLLFKRDPPSPLRPLQEKLNMGVSGAKEMWMNSPLGRYTKVGDEDDKYMRV